MTDPRDVVPRMFDLHKNLWVDISIREYEIAPNEKNSSRVGKALSGIYG